MQPQQPIHLRRLWIHLLAEVRSSNLCLVQPRRRELPAPLHHELEAAHSAAIIDYRLQLQLAVDPCHAAINVTTQKGVREGVRE